MILDTGRARPSQTSWYSHVDEGSLNGLSSSLHKILATMSFILILRCGVHLIHQMNMY